MRGTSFQTTYEELKRQRHSVCEEERDASRLPMRNWNFPTICLPQPVSASRLPMRNWNPNFRLVIRFWDGSASRLPMRNWNPNWAVTVLEGSGFQTTYEELKHKPICFSDDIPSQASRLPMRNWNPYRASGLILYWFIASHLRSE